MESLLLSEEDSSGEEARQGREPWNSCCSLRRTLVVKRLGRDGSHGILADYSLSFLPSFIFFFLSMATDKVIITTRQTKQIAMPCYPVLKKAEVSCACEEL